ncbi:MAG TPA: acetyl-CoA carboxylase biotin carboxylase subunit [Candidatus Saccharimonadales bacterium]|nr:acetyl-CoA carboxylase biotin carboxylase subunit [Candidatus Saccharimonadales bacterium]
MFNRILIANRGEIAVRVIRACREMGIESVAVYSDVDRRALHVRKADFCEHLGPAQASESYLNIPKILEAARRSGAEAIHPGYGFLSENAGFARACRDAGIVFIGPSPESMEMMGSKTKARQQMKKANVPFVPGTDTGLKSAEEALAVAESIGYPVMLKASAGGGGKGMRMVTTPAELASALASAQSEAQRSFGDSEVYIEKFIQDPRHVEMQIFGDTQGNVIYLAERECSVQRRHQKVLEEAPCSFVDPDMRRRMGEIAVRVGKAANYCNAGTVEFLVDAKKNFYFLEMNTRLQVEHPVTEMVTGIDLVQLQIRVAAGEPLPIKQDEIVLRGHAMELRVYAEDPDNNFFPSPGRITRIISPSGPGIRRDSGMYEGWVVPLDYDPLLAKLIAYGEDRPQVINRLRRALVEYFIGGIKTNISLFRRILLHPDFQAGRVDTGFLDRLLKEPPVGDARTARRTPIVALAAAIFAQQPPPGSQPARNQDGLHATSPRTAAPASNGTTKPGGWKAAARTEGVGK